MDMKKFLKYKYDINKIIFYIFIFEVCSIYIYYLHLNFIIDYRKDHGQDINMNRLLFLN